ncbi:MAG: hypothetical protein ACE5EK_04040 [Nitrospinales bacterium]
MTEQNQNTAELIKAAETVLDVLNEASLVRSLSPDEEHVRDLLQDALTNF